MNSEYYLQSGLPIEGGPSPDGLDAEYWMGLQEERIKIQRCNSCLTWQWGPEWICHKCLSSDMGWCEVPPNGIIYSWQRVWHPAHAALTDQGPYIVVLVELPAAGNVRVVGNLLGNPQQNVNIGAEVVAHFEHHSDTENPYTLLQWRVAN